MSKNPLLAISSTIKRLVGPSNNDWINWFEDWTELLKAYLPTTEATTLSLEMLKNHSGNVHLIAAIELAQERVNAGMSLANAFEDLPYPVPNEIFLALECGQQTGRLVEVCQAHLAAWKERISARQNLVKSMAYPFIVLMASGFCWWLLDFTTASIKKSLPANSSAWSLSEFLIIIGMGLLLIVLPKALNDRKHKNNQSSKGMTLKGFSPAKAWYTAQFFFSIEQELKAGFDIMYCLRHRPLKNHRPFLGQKNLHKALNLQNARLHQLLKNGANFTEAMSESGAPDFMVRHAQISEQTGNLASVYSTGVKLFQLEAQKRQRRIQSVLGPLTLMLAALTLIVAYQTSIAPIYSNLSVL